MATYYWTYKYPSPMVVVPGMGLFYRGSDCHLWTPLSRGLHRMLSKAICDGGDFTIERVDDERPEVLLSIDSTRAGSWTSVHGFGRWNHFISALVKVQLRVRRLQSRLSRVREFQKTHRGMSLPDAIVDEIVHLCFEKKYRHQVEVFRVETMSFRLLV